MKYFWKVVIALAVAIFALPWPVTVVIRALSMSLDYGMGRLTLAAKDTKDSSVKALCLLVSGLLVLTGIWPAALLLAFITLWHERLILWLFVTGINIEDTRVKPGKPDEPEPEQGMKFAKVHKLQPQNQIMTTPQAVKASLAQGLDMLHLGFEWSVENQCWYDEKEAVGTDGSRIGWIKDGRLKTA